MIADPFDNPYESFSNVPSDSVISVSLVWFLSGETISTFRIGKNSTLFEGSSGPVQHKEIYLYIYPDGNAHPFPNPLQLVGLSWTGIPLRQETRVFCSMCLEEYCRRRPLAMFQDGYPGLIVDASGRRNWLCQDCQQENLRRSKKASSPFNLSKHIIY